MAKAATPKPRFKIADRVRYRTDGGPLGAGVIVRTVPGTIRDTEAPADPYEVAIVAWDGEDKPDMCWSADLELMPTPVPGLAQAVEALGKAEKASIVEDLEQFDD